MTGSSNHVLKGSCFCGNVSYSVFTPPVLSAYCHCSQCQRFTASPFVHSMHFEEKDFVWTHSEPHADHLDFYDNPLKPHKRRYRCKKCGVTVTSYNSKVNRFSVWGALLERNEEGKIKNWDIAKPTAHMFYGTRMLDVGDDLGKWEGYENKSQRLA
ncbi:hypothetical protein SERLA73DRAFT_44695 [Serpula lacrymans var. lacrymans S7.3]|uniref:CENP-V/GFA domain-containing protein n=1 Tax=Serpula lacrymans var. lacrymans (strain S7.3) TaxID=936435 RepID=F8PFJ8_SERL3|nr:hypothetical protein SERLA73DRAFT_44695 [Serpula lacrymans var. lacrymans S7.3]